jgi:hypothetical protein
MATEKLTTRLKNKTWNNPYTKNLKNWQELRLSTPKIQVTRKHILKFQTQLTPSLGKTVILHWFK